MTLKSALRAIKKNPNLLLKRGNDLYYVDTNPYYGGCPQSVRLYLGVDDAHGNNWEHGFAYASSQHSNKLAVGYKELTATDWELLDGEDIAVSATNSWDVPAEYVKKFDDKNKYHPDQSIYGQKLLKEANKMLKSIGSPCKLVFKGANYGMQYFHLQSPKNVEQKWRFKSTKAIFELTKKLIEAEDEREEQALFDANKPSGDIIITKVNMQEFLDRLQNSDKLWFLDATNSWKRTRAGKAVGKDWMKANLRPVKLVRSRYGGARTDRLATRNAFTNQIGLPECKGNAMYSLDDKGGAWGTFFADVVKSYGREGDSIIVDGNEMLVLVHDKKLPNPHAEYSYIRSITSPRERRVDSNVTICKILNQRLSSFKSYMRS